ncbi:hypothetical protein Ciccas_001248 [Cichlidogyrus casuarinus]|uniref:Uncharacterized protein n=1 Tax=Cichlidogyrus casuarinus TaxID=1844966 RepID=A0ABD2QKN0_9PLAT
MFEDSPTSAQSSKLQHRAPVQVSMGPVMADNLENLAREQDFSLRCAFHTPQSQHTFMPEIGRKRSLHLQLADHAANYLASFASEAFQKIAETAAQRINFTDLVNCDSSTALDQVSLSSKHACEFLFIFAYFCSRLGHHIARY